MGAGNDSNPPFASAADAFRLYNADANYEGPEAGQHYYEFRYADAAFFVMDTRRYRSDITKTRYNPSPSTVSFIWGYLRVSVQCAVKETLQIVSYS